MSNYYNEAGEPLMDGSAMRYEMYLDSMDEPDYDMRNDAYDDEIDPADCDHDGYSFRESGDIECDYCYDTIGVWSERDADGWPIAHMF